MPSDRMWFYGTVGKPKGPVNEGTLRAKFESGELGPDTLVWTRGMPYWVPAREQEVFAKHWDPKSLVSRKVPQSSSAGWYFSHQGKIWGPVTQDSLCEMAKSGSLGPDTPIMRDGEKSWQPLWQVSELQGTIVWGGKTASHIPPAARAAVAPDSSFSTGSQRGASVSAGFQAVTMPSLQTQYDPSAGESESSVSLVKRVNYAGFWHRFFAHLIDYILLALVAFVLGIYMFQSESFRYIVIVTQIHFMYFTSFNSSELQGTVGKKLLGLQVCDLRGHRISYGRAVQRYLLEQMLYLPLFLLFLILGVVSTGGGHGDVEALEGTLGLIIIGVLIFILVNFIRVAWTPRKQTYYDQWAGTLVLVADDSGYY